MKYKDLPFIIGRECGISDAVIRKEFFTDNPHFQQHKKLLNNEIPDDKVEFFKAFYRTIFKMNRAEFKEFKRGVEETTAMLKDQQVRRSN